MSAEDWKVERSYRPCVLNGEKTLNSMQSASWNPAHGTSSTPDEEPEAAGEMQLKFLCLASCSWGEDGVGRALGLQQGLARLR